MPPCISFIDAMNIQLAPNTYTSRDVVELHVHSGRAVTSAVLSALSLMPSLRPAEPGEFTRWAFESGRIDLTEAEGIRDLVDAETDLQRKLALESATVIFPFSSSLPPPFNALIFFR